MSDIYSTQATQVTPDSLAIRRKMAAALLQSAGSTEPVRAWSQGANRIAEGLLGGYMLNKADKEQNAEREQSIKDFTAALGGGAPAAPAPAPSQAPPPPDSASIPRGYRNNNPLNIEDGAFTQGQPGYGGTDGRFAKFASLDQGTGAANALLDSYGRRGLNTPAGIINRWAPSADGNNTQAYADTVAKALGIGPNDPVPTDKRQALIAAMAQHENGAPLPQQAPQAASAQPQVAQPQQGAINPALIRALSNQFLPPAMGQIAAGQINQQLTPPELKLTKDMMNADVPNTWDARRGLWNGKPLQPGASLSGVASDATPEEMAASFEKQYPGSTARAEQIFRGEGGVPNKRQNPIDGPAMQLLLTKHPEWSINDFKAKSVLRADLAKSSPNSMGGILSNGKSAFGHLATLSDNLADLGNANGPDFPGGGHVATVGNYVGNAMFPTSDTKAKIVGVNDNALKYGQESTKFYAGTGGGEGERMAALQTLNPKTMSGQEQAAFLRVEKDLMIERMRQKERQVRETLGDEHLSKKPIFDSDLQASIKKIDANIAKLTGKAPVSSQGAAPITKSIGGKTYIQQNGQWFEQ